MSSRDRSRVRFVRADDGSEASGENSVRFTCDVDVHADEALVIGVKPPVCDGWRLGFGAHPGGVAVTHADAVLESDGRLVVVVSREQPVHPNWLPLADNGHAELLMDWLRPDDHPRPTIDRVAVDRLRHHLPPRDGAAEQPRRPFWQRWFARG